MNEDRFIACDWGTSNLRLYFCAYRDGVSPAILESRAGPGVSRLNEDIEAAFFGLADDWITAHGPMPVIISGMAGSSLGWREAPYLQCPVDASQIAEGRITFESRGLHFSIVAGLSATNPLGSPDVMRGEELQLLGWMQLSDTAGDGTRLVILPGTHSKWVLLRNGRIETFLTALTGELFSVLQSHSVLIAAVESASFDRNAFEKGLATIDRLGDAHLLHALFTTRSRQVSGALSAADAPSYLSGLLIGSDVAGATALFRKTHPEIDGVTVIGDSPLAGYYRLALEHFGLRAAVSDTEQVSIAGFEAVYKSLYRKESTRC